MDDRNYERAQLEVSREELMEGVFDKLGLRCVVDCIDAHVAVSGLYDAAGDLVAEGAGKGSYCKIGAMAEAVEHYCLQQEKERSLCNFSSKLLSSQEALRKDGVIRSLSNFDVSLECVVFYEVYGAGELIVPKILVSPEDDLSKYPDCLFLERYSTNSGSAFGCTLDEALLHGVNEVVERHVLSLIMLDSVGVSSGLEINKLSSGDVEEIILSLGLEAGEAIRVYYVSDVFSSFFCMAVRNRQGGEFLLPQLGSGCSQSFILALSRSIFELRQAELLYGYEERLIDEQALRIMESSKRLESLRQLFPRNLRSSDERPPLVGVEGQQPGRQLERMVRSLNAHGYKVYYRIVRRINEFSFVTQVYVPGLERFNLIRSGKWVASQEALLKPFN